MKTIRLFIVAASVMVLETFGTAPRAKAQTAASPPNLPAPTPWSVAASDANSRVWERTVYRSGPNGAVVARTQRYTELASGLNFWRGQWLPSRAEIDLLPSGEAFAAAATNGQHQAWFPLDISKGVIQLSTTD
jgi:hypothetical protein